MQWSKRGSRKQMPMKPFSGGSIYVVWFLSWYGCRWSGKSAWIRLVYHSTVKYLGIYNYLYTQRTHLRRRTRNAH